ncbi:MAG: small multi-drug export protein [Candidatus Thermoplasmatota archaeon]|nr:small multi-drug export protein [Candidatus Thermoplasmatota archaeon]
MRNRAFWGLLAGLIASIAYTLLARIEIVADFLQNMGLLWLHVNPNVAYVWWPIGRILFWAALGFLIGFFLQPKSKREKQWAFAKKTIVKAIKDSRYPKFWIGALKFLAPFSIAVVAICLMWTFMPQAQAGKIYGIMATYLFTPIGRFIVLSGPAIGLTFWEMMLAVMVVDMLCSLFVVWNFDLILSIPWLGEKLRKAVESVHAFLFRWKWLQGLAFLGVVLFVAVPISGTNAIVGTVLGRIIGMGKTATYISVTIGAFIGASIIALPAYGLLSLIF